MKFAIFYEDGSVVEGDGEDKVTLTFEVSKTFLNAPPDGIQAIVVENPYSCRYVWRGQDYYYTMDRGGIHATDDLGAYLRKHLQGMVKFGLCLNDDEYQKVMQKVKDYTGIPSNCERQPHPEKDLD